MRSRCSPTTEPSSATTTGRSTSRPKTARSCSRKASAANGLSRRGQDPRKVTERPLQRVLDCRFVLGRPIPKESMRRTRIGDNFPVRPQRGLKRGDLIRGDARVRAAENAEDRDPDLPRKLQRRETAWLRLKMP